MLKPLLFLSQREINGHILTAYGTESAPFFVDKDLLRFFNSYSDCTNKYSSGIPQTEKSIKAIRRNNSTRNMLVFTKLGARLFILKYANQLTLETLAELAKAFEELPKKMNIETEKAALEFIDELEKIADTSQLYFNAKLYLATIEKQLHKEVKKLVTLQNESSNIQEQTNIIANDINILLRKKEKYSCQLRQF